jgi:hypothetical protein
MKVLARSRYGAAKSGSGRARSDRQRPAAAAIRGRPFLTEHADDNRFCYYKWRCSREGASFPIGQPKGRPAAQSPDVAERRWPALCTGPGNSEKTGKPRNSESLPRVSSAERRLAVWGGATHRSSPPMTRTDSLSIRAAPVIFTAPSMLLDMIILRNVQRSRPWRDLCQLTVAPH